VTMVSWRDEQCTAGVHNPGWKLKDIDEENYRLWWVYDLTGGRIPLADRNAKLSDRAKYYMYRLNKFGGYAQIRLCRHFSLLPSLQKTQGLGAKLSISWVHASNFCALYLSS